MDTALSAELTKEPPHFILSAVPAPTPTTEQIEFFRRVRASRIKSKKSAAEIADYLGCTPPTYNKYEKENEMPRRRLLRFCEITGTDLCWLMGGTVVVIGMTVDQVNQLIADEEAVDHKRRSRRKRTLSDE